MAPRLGLVLFEVCLLAFLICPSDGLFFSAFNVKWLTTKKYNKPIVSETLLKILDRYDIILIQEIRGDGIQLMTQLLRDINSRSRKAYSYVMSKKTGRTTYKEQYAFVYRQDAGFTVEAVVQYPDLLDRFEREPYIILIKAPWLRVKEFAIIGAHIKPDKVVAELNSMVSVYDFAVDLLGTKNILLAGDFNADCSYLSNRKYRNLLLTTDWRFDWLIDKYADTTVSTKTDCAYDRFVISQTLKDSVVKGSVSIFDFQEDLSLSYEDARTVSDHFPIELELF